MPLPYYLLRNNGTYSDLAMYDQRPADRPEGVWVQGKPSQDIKSFIVPDLNRELQDAFLGMLPKHLGKPYLTPQVVLEVGLCKQVITDFNKLGMYELSAASIQALNLPEQMLEDKEALLAMLPIGG